MGERLSKRPLGVGSRPGEWKKKFLLVEVSLSAPALRI